MGFNRRRGCRQRLTGAKKKVTEKGPPSRRNDKEGKVMAEWSG